MNDIRSVKLEFLRPGPAHNQLLSPLTPYVAVCGDDGSVTVHMPFEHRELLTRLKRLRYENNADPASDEQRQAEVRGIGEAIGAVIGQVPALLSAISNVGNQLVHLRLVLSPSELGMVPFEMAIAPSAFPGSGRALFLQPHTPITVTREVRRGAPLKVDWNRKPRILFAFATPPGYRGVPAQDHLNALRRAIEPWVPIVGPDPEEKRLDKVKEILTVLPDASLESIRQACANQAYTHVHILAHGDRFNEAGDRRFGIALCSTLDPDSADVVDGTRLAIALTAGDSSNDKHPPPTFVSLATCDSGNIESVLTPGGSIAHELHMSGIPWVVASQFPLWMRASTMAAEILYEGLLSGDDPRRVLFDLRQRLRANAPGTHDWASIVAYATLPPDFAQQVQRFRYDQSKRRAEVQFDRLDTLARLSCDREPTKELCAEMALREDKLRELIRVWLDEAEGTDDPGVASERLGMCGAFEKRIALNAKKAFGHNATTMEKGRIRSAYEASQNYYKQALRRDPTNHWVITQYLSLEAVYRIPGTEGERREDLWPWWQATWQIACWKQDAGGRAEQIWAIGTKLELLVLGAIFAPQGAWQADERRKEAEGLAADMVKLIRDDRFPLESTIRQFKRYRDTWRNPAWDDLVQTTLTALQKRR